MLFILKENVLKPMRNAELERKKKRIVIGKMANGQRLKKNVGFVKRKKEKTVIKVKRMGVEKKLRRNAVKERNVSAENVKKKKNAKLKWRSRKSPWKLRPVRTMKKVPKRVQWNRMLRRNPTKPTKRKKRRKKNL